MGGAVFLGLLLKQIRTGGIQFGAADPQKAPVQREDPFIGVVMLRIHITHESQKNGKGQNDGHRQHGIAADVAPHHLKGMAQNAKGFPFQESTSLRREYEMMYV